MKKARKKLIIRMWLECFGVILLIVIIALVVRKNNKNRVMADTPLDSGVIYDKFDSEKATNLLLKYYDGINKQDMTVLQDVFYSDDFLKTLMDYNECSAEELTDIIKNEVEGVTLDIRDVKYVSHKAYSEEYMGNYNTSIEGKTEVKDSIEGIYDANFTYKSQDEEGNWTEKDLTVKIYVTKGEYRLWPINGSSSSLTTTSSWLY